MLVVAIVVLQGEFEVDVVLGGGLDVHHRVHRDLALVEKADEAGEAVGRPEHLAAALGAFVGEDDAHARVEERELAQAGGDDIPLVDGVGAEHRRIRLVVDPGATFVAAADHLQRAGGLAAGEAQAAVRAIAVHVRDQPFADCVDA